LEILALREIVSLDKLLSEKGERNNGDIQEEWGLDPLWFLQRMLEWRSAETRCFVSSYWVD